MAHAGLLMPRSLLRQRKATRPSLGLFHAFIRGNQDFLQGGPDVRVSKSALAMLAACLALPLTAHAGGPVGIDHTVRYDNSGVWKRSNQQIVYYGSIVSVAAGAIWLGDRDELGDTLWRSVDAMVITGVGTQALKWGFGRERPSQTSNP